MTLGRLMELYQAEQQGKQIMMRKYHYKYSYEDIKEIKLSECKLSKLVLDDDINESGYSYTFFIKDEEDKYGVQLWNTKINIKKL